MPSARLLPFVFLFALAGGLPGCACGSQPFPRGLAGFARRRQLRPRAGGRLLHRRLSLPRLLRRLRLGRSGGLGGYWLSLC